MFGGREWMDSRYSKTMRRLLSPLILVGLCNTVQAFLPLAIPWYPDRHATSFRLQQGPSNGDEQQQQPQQDDTTLVSVRLASGLTRDEEWPLLQDVLRRVSNSMEFMISFDQAIVMEHPVESKRYHGTTGRILLLQTNQPEREDDLEIFQASVSGVIDDILYTPQVEGATLHNPFLICFVDQSSTSSFDQNATSFATLLLDQCIEQYEMALPISKISGTENKSISNLVETDSRQFIPTEVLEVDGAYVQEDWDTSLVAVFDGLLNDNLRHQLFTLVAGEDDDAWSSAKDKHPNPKLWTGGGLLDLPTVSEEEEESPTTTCCGLFPQAIENLCNNQHEAILQTEQILTELFRDFHVTRLPEAVLGPEVSPLTANAPVAGDSFQMHIDGDPFYAPPSPWTDVYGRYPNRCRGKPRFVSVLFYLNSVWESTWGASTSVWDVATDTQHSITPLPGRCLFMDQDVSHSVTAPNNAEYGPRYSLVWKLVLHPKHANQDMKSLSCGRSWPRSSLLGSANRGTAQQQVS